MGARLKWWLSMALVAVGLNLLSWGAIWRYCDEQAEERWSTVAQVNDQTLVAAAVNGKRLSVQTARQKAGLPPVQRSEQAQAQVYAANLHRAQHDLDTKG